MGTVRAHRAHRPSLIVAFVVMALWAQVAAPTAAACSCVEPQPMATYAVDPRVSVLTGVPGLLQARGVPIQVTGWFKGPGAAAVVWLSAGSFGNQGASCERTPPTAGLEFIFVLYMPEDGSDPSGSICTPMAGLIGVEGKAMLADALATFGAPVEPIARPVSPGEPFDELADLAPAVAVIALGAGLLALVIGGLTRLGRRRSGGADGTPGAG